MMVKNVVLAVEYGVHESDTPSCDKTIERDHSPYKQHPAPSLVS